jgi:cation diffusion facilitator family transporter
LAYFFKPGFVAYFCAKFFVLEKNRENYSVQQWVVVVAIVLFGLKFAAYFLTMSVAILTDALESTVNVIAGIIGLYSLYVSAKPSDQNHPYGHGKAEFISAAIEGTLIILAGIFMIGEAVHNLISPGKIQKLDTGILLVGISAAVNFGMGYYATKKGQRNNSLALEASGRHLQSDTYSTLAVIAGLIMIQLTKIQQIDSVMAIVISVVIMFVGYRIARRSLAGIMDEADQKILAQLVSLLNLHRHENWIDIHNLRVIKFGNVLHVDCHLTVPWYLNVRDSQVEIEKLIQLIKTEFGESIEFFVHADGCLDYSCSICIKGDCQVRKHPFAKRINWTLDNIISDVAHRLPNE